MQGALLLFDMHELVSLSARLGCACLGPVQILRQQFPAKLAAFILRS
jgi:hypothetical protein